MSIKHIVYYTVVLADGLARKRKITSNRPTLYNINVHIIRKPLENSPSVCNISNILTGLRRRRRTTITLHHIIHSRFSTRCCILLKVRFCYAIDTSHRVRVQTREVGIKMEKGFMGIITLRTIYYTYAIINL